eukprot:TRINITY_DN2949_c0_g1_i1.p1 TRINITY_DN2949_c0_g1~~TRINITY_DN2949_c0_g1_i1.p1  ORF type:complete len:283 (-),score=93.05 TRINITY_DN2949_c0_g1_i1:100-867(-)
MGKVSSKELHDNAYVLSESQTKKYLQKSEKMLATIRDQYPFVENLEEAACLSDIRKPDQPLMFVNHHFQWMTLYDREEIMGKNCRFLQGRFTNRETVREIRDAIAAGVVKEVEILNYRKDGIPFWNIFTLYPIFKKKGSKEVTHYLAIQRDVTLLKQANKPINQWSPEELVFHFQCLRFPDPLLDEMFERRLTGEQLVEMKRDKIEALIRSKKELAEEAESLLETLLHEIDFLTKDPEYFAQAQKKLREHPKGEA